MPNDSQTKRAEALWRAARKERTARKRAAEAAVTRWTWVNRQVTALEPGLFESTKRRPGKVLASKPTKLDGVSEEGFDARGRLRVSRKYTTADEIEETFIDYVAGGIEEVVYAPDAPASVRFYVVNDRGQIAGFHAVDDMGRGYVYRTRRTYSFDARGFYTGFEEECDTGDGKVVPHAFEYECDHSGRIVRSWWLWESGSRQLYWKFKPAANGSAKSAPAKVTPRKANAKRAPSAAARAPTSSRKRAASKRATKR